MAFLSKVIEKAAILPLNEHLSKNDLQEPFQSAYKCLHSTETALLKVQNDILTALDKRNPVVLLLLDLSSAFEQTTLLLRLKSHYGITNKALVWFESYLRHQSQAVMINNTVLSPCNLTFGVPQGSVLGPVVFSLYLAPMIDIIQQHKLQFHLYADDSQTYLAFNPACPEELSTVKSTIKTCIADVCVWMSSNSLKLNDKSELMVFHSQHNPLLDISSIVVGGECISPAATCHTFNTTLIQIHC